MLILFSRAAQAKFVSQCNSCSNFATIFIQRRFGATKVKPFSAGDIFTACYSTIFAAAALADSKVKDNRLHEWDRLIAEARVAQLALEEKNTCHSQFEPASRLSDSLKPSPITNSNTSNANHNFFACPAWHLRKEMKEGKTKPFNKQSRLITISTDYSNENPVINTFIHEEPDLDAPERDISDTAELNLLRKNINGLVLRLLKMSTIHECLTTEDEAVNYNKTQIQLEIMKQRLKSLPISFESLPLFNYEGPEIAKQQAKEFNAILWSICRKASGDKDSINLMIAKICYNLLIAAVPPNTETYDILLYEFALLQIHEFAEQVLQSFWFSRLMPNKRTVELIILHYKVRKDRDGLNLMMRMMRGNQGNLMQSAIYAKKYRAKCTFIDGSNQIHNFDPQNPVIRKGMKKQKLYFRSGYLYKKSPRDKHIFDALITAHFELKGLRPAIRYFSAAIREGSNIKSSTLCLVINSCIQRADFTSGLEILMIILSQWKLSGYHEQIQFSPLVRHHVYRLLFFCGIDPNQGVKGHLPSRITKYTESMIVREIEFPKEAIRKMLYLMKIQSLRERISRNSELITKLRTVLNLEETPFFLPTITKFDEDKRGIQEALRILKTATKREAKINREYNYSTNSHVGFDLRFRGLQANYITSFSKMEEISTNLIMIRLQICASKLNLMSRIISSRTKVVITNTKAAIDIQILRNLGLRLSLLHMQLRVEIYLNLWWIRRLGLASSLSRSLTQRKRLNFICQILTNVEWKTSLLWEQINNG